MDELNQQSTATDKFGSPFVPKVPFNERYGISPILFGFLSLILIFILYQIVGGVITLLIFGIKPTPENIFGYRLATALGQIVFILVPTLLLVRLASNNQREYFRLKLPTLQMIIVPLIGIFSLQQMLQVYMVCQEKLPLPEEIQSVMQKFKEMFEALYRQLVATSSVPEFLWVLIVVALIPAIAEEFMFRGLIQRSFEKGLTPLRGMVFTGIIFGAYHLNPVSFIPLALIGIYLGFLTMRSGSIWVSVVTHFFNNALAVVSLYLNLKDDYVVFGNAEEMSLVSLMITFWFFGIVFIVSLLYFIKITKSKTPVYETDPLINDNNL